MDRPGAVERPLARLRAAVAALAAAELPHSPSWCVALSGGADSLALTAAAAALHPTVALIGNATVEPLGAYYGFGAPVADLLNAAVAPRLVRAGCRVSHVG